MQYPYSTKDKILYWAFGDKIPLTKLVIVSNILTFFAIGLLHLDAIGSHMIFSADAVIRMPWTLVTYAFVSTRDPIGLAFGCYWIWIAGGSLERAWGTQRYATYFLSMVAITALGLFTAANTVVKGISVATAGLWLPIAGVTVAFAMLNPEQQILFMFVLPLKLKYLALIDAALVLIGYGMTSPLLGIFALAGCAYSYWYVLRPRLSRASAPKKGQVVRVYESRGTFHGLNPLNWIKDYKESRRLKKFLERSGLNEDDRSD